MEEKSGQVQQASSEAVTGGHETKGTNSKGVKSLRQGQKRFIDTQYNEKDGPGLSETAEGSSARACSGICALWLKGVLFMIALCASVYFMLDVQWISVDRSVFTMYV